MDVRKVDVPSRCNLPLIDRLFANIRVDTDLSMVEE